MNTNSAIATLYKHKVEVLYNNARSYVYKLGEANAGALDNVGLSFGGVSRYGQVLAYYDPNAHMVVVPTGNPNMSIAKFGQSGVQAVNTELASVLIHEMIHAADMTSKIDNCAHSTDGWCRQVATMVFIETSIKHDWKVLQSIIKFDNINKGAYPASNALAAVIRRAEPSNVHKFTLDAVAEAVAEIDKKANGEIKNCACCGESMVAKRRTKLYCSSACRLKAFNQEDNNLRNARIAYDKAHAEAIKFNKKRNELIANITASEAQVKAISERLIKNKQELAALMQFA